MKTVLLSLALASAVVSCSKEGSGGGKPKATDLPDLGLVIDVSGADLNDMTMGDQKTTMIRASNTVLSVAQGKPDKTLESVLEDSKMYEGSKVTKQDKTADGWHAEWNNKGGMGNENYFLDIRRTINGKPFDCTTTVANADQRTAAAAACATLRAK
jgi:hypothetical protein